MIIPAILTDNVVTVHTKLKAFEQLDTSWVHIDIMDGKFVDTKSVLPSELQSIKTSAQIEFHLMCISPEKYFDDCVAAGAKRIIIHVEAVEDLDTTITALENLNVEIGLALSPATEVEALSNYIDRAHLILLLGVIPGRQGQQFISSVTTKIPHLRNMKPGIAVSIDGGINHETLQVIAPYRLNYYIVGSALNNEETLLQDYTQLSKIISY